MKSLCLVFSTIALALAITSPSWSAVIVDGQLDPDYGAPLSIQITQTSVINATDGLIDGSNGSELDAGYGFIADGALHLFLAGNLMTDWCGVELCSITDDLVLLFDTKPGGQNPIRVDNPSILGAPALGWIGGMTLDADFVPDYFIGCRGNGYPIAPYYMSASYAELPAAGGGAAYALGNATAGGPGTLSGGSNPFGVLASIDNRNVAGVDGGCGASSGIGVTKGIELSIPLGAIGNPSDCIKLSAFVVDYTRVSNQVLGPVPPGTCTLGVGSAVNFASLAGSQYFSVCPAPTATRGATWGRVKAIYR